MPDNSFKELVDEWRDIEGRSHIFGHLKSIYEQGGTENLEGFVLLIVKPNGSLGVMRQRSYRDAVTNLLRIESDQPDWDVVLAAGDRGESLRNAFRNYFQNSTEFVRLMEGAVV
jgi:hypothetical protein